MKLNELYEVAAKAQSYPFLSNASVFFAKVAGEKIPLNSVCMVEAPSSISLIAPDFPSNGSAFMLIGGSDSGAGVEISGANFYIDGEIRNNFELNSNKFTVIFVYSSEISAWKIAGSLNNELHCETLDSELLILSSTSARTQSLKSLNGNKDVIVEQSFIGTIVSVGDGSNAIFLKAQGGEVLCELSAASNIRMVFIYYDYDAADFVVVYQGLFSDFTSDALQVYNGQNLINEKVKKIFFEENLFSIGNLADSDSISLKFNTTNFLTSNTEILTVSAKSLSTNDGFFQLLDPNGANRDVIISELWTGKIINNSDGVWALILKNGAGTILEELSITSGIKAVSVWYDGTSHCILQESSYSFENISFSGYTTTTVKTADYGAKSGERILCNTSGGSFKIVTPRFGRFQIVDASDETISENDGFGINPLTIEANNSTILGQPFIQINKGLSAPEFEYVAAQNDWKILNFIDDPVRTFSVRGEITVPSQNTKQILIAKHDKNLRIKSISGFTGQGFCTISIKKGESQSLSSFSNINFSPTFTKYSNENPNLLTLTADTDYYQLIVVSQNYATNLSYTIWLEAF